MARRPRTSSSRPYTSSGRPSTALPQTATDEYFDHDPQYTAYSQDYLDEEDEESEAEDVFAFGPPSTADQDTKPSVLSPLGPEYPQPTFDPQYRYPPDSAPGPSSAYPSSYARHPYPLSPNESYADDPYRAHRLAPTASTPNTGTLSAVSSAVSSRDREVRIALPANTAVVDEEDALEDEHDRRKNRTSASSTPATASILDDSRDGSIKMEFDFDTVEEEDSPYPEVRASVSNIDDPEMPVLTIRMWLTGLSLTLITGAANVFFSFRQPAPQIAPTLIVLLAHPLGKMFAYVLPTKIYRVFGREVVFNPGPWNIKEHTLVYMMSNVAASSPYALNAVVVTQIKYNVDFGFWFTVILTLATQLTGFGIAGMCRRFMVWPASMIWPQNLVISAMLNTLHAEEDRDRGGLSRYKYFCYVTAAAFAFFFLPGYLFTALSIFSWVCWIAPNNIVLNQVFGTASGLGVSCLTFDWTQITWLGSPLVIPWWAEVHYGVMFSIMYFLVVPVLYYTNTWKMAYLPMFSSSPYDRFGNIYNISQVITSEERFDVEAYKNYSPLYLPACFAMSYLIAFAAASAVIVHTVLFHSRALVDRIKRIQVEKDDIHAKLMRAYPEVPDWWYLVAFVVFFSLAVVACEIWHTGMPVWGLLLAVLVPIVYVVPAGIMYAISGTLVNVNLLGQILPATLLPGQPIANMIFKVYSIQTLAEAITFVQDLKLGHYVKIPARATFVVQLVSTVLAAFVQAGVKQWMFDNIQDICTPHQASSLTCPSNQVFYTASAVWGLIGPTRQFGSSSIYHPELYALIVGAVLPIPVWLWQKYYPNSWNSYIHIPLALTSLQFIPPATGINYTSFFLVGFIFQYLVRRRNFTWWSKFNYVTSAAMDSGTLLSLLVIFFTLQFPKGGVSVKWWGNNIYKNTADARGLPLLTTPAEGF